MSATRYAQYCKLTCLGGSEVGTCPCKHPASCEMQDRPDFAAAREAAKRRLFRLAGFVEVVESDA